MTINPLFFLYNYVFSILIINYFFFICKNCVLFFNKIIIELEFMCAMFDDCSAEFKDQDLELLEYEKEIEQVYNATIGHENLDMHVDSLTMLTFIETRLEDLIDIEERLPPSRVKDAQKDIDKQHRIQVRVFC